jgi:hypothetical protein
MTEAELLFLVALFLAGLALIRYVTNPSISLKENQQ